jgi:hypothetical protein
LLRPSEHGCSHPLPVRGKGRDRITLSKLRDLDLAGRCEDASIWRKATTPSAEAAGATQRRVLVAARPAYRPAGPNDRPVFEAASTGPRVAAPAARRSGDHGGLLARTRGTVFSQPSLPLRRGSFIGAALVGGSLICAALLSDPLPLAFLGLSPDGRFLGLRLRGLPLALFAPPLFGEARFFPTNPSFVARAGIGGTAGRTQELLPSDLVGRTPNRRRTTAQQPDQNDLDGEAPQAGPRTGGRHGGHGLKNADHVPLTHRRPALQHPPPQVSPSSTQRSPARALTTQPVGPGRSQRHRAWCLVSGGRATPLQGGGSNR